MSSSSGSSNEVELKQLSTIAVLSIKYHGRIAEVKAALPDALVPRFEEEDIVRALAARKGNVVHATELLQKYAHIGIDFPHLYTLMCAPRFTHTLLETVIVAPVPEVRTKDGLFVLYVDMGSWDVNALSCEEALAATMILYDMASFEHGSLEPGFILINDMGSVTARQLTANSPKTYARAMRCIYEHMMCQPKKTYFINYSLMAELAYKAMKPFLPKQQTESSHYVKKEKLYDVLGEDVVRSKRYIPTREHIDEHTKRRKERLPFILQKYDKIMLKST